MLNPTNALSALSVYSPVSPLNALNLVDLFRRFSDVDPKAKGWTKSPCSDAESTVAQPPNRIIGGAGISQVKKENQPKQAM
jgi:hypothetical protein